MEQRSRVLANFKLNNSLGTEPVRSFAAVTSCRRQVKKPSSEQATYKIIVPQKQSLNTCEGTNVSWDDPTLKSTVNTRSRLGFATEVEIVLSTCI